MTDAHWQAKSLKALATRTAESTLEELPFGGAGSTPDRTIDHWLRGFFGDLVDLHTDKIRLAVTLATNLLGDDVRGGASIWMDSVDDRDERKMKVRLLDTSSRKLFKILPRASAVGRSQSTSGPMT
jgi:hypothetical protein